MPLILSLILAMAACDEGPTNSDPGGEGGGGAATLRAVVLSPATASTQVGGTVQFNASGQMTDGTNVPMQVTYTATGGSITSAGLYTAGAAGGTFRVIATASGGLADTSSVVVTGTAGTPPQQGNYTAVASQSWQYASAADLRAANLFWWPDGDVARYGSVNNYIDLVADPTFGKVARITQPQSNDQIQGATPRTGVSFAPIDKMWYRWRMKFSPGWTTVGPYPSGHANAYKIAFWHWEGYDGRGQVNYTNTNGYEIGTGVLNSSTGQYIQYSETQLPGSQSFGSATTEWSDNEWWEFVVYYEKTGPGTANQHYWRRRLTSSGQIVNNPWVYHGYQMSGSVTPRVSGISLGVNKNKSTPAAQHIYWGPWEVVDGSRFPNPWGMPNL